jgi:hypothetical protein
MAINGICHSQQGLLCFFLGHILFFLCFASVQNSETYPQVRGKNKQVLKNKIISMLYDVKQDKNLIYFFFQQIIKYIP